MTYHERHMQAGMKVDVECAECVKLNPLYQRDPDARPVRREYQSLSFLSDIAMEKFLNEESQGLEVISATPILRESRDLCVEDVMTWHVVVRRVGR